MHLCRLGSTEPPIDCNGRSPYPFSFIVLLRRLIALLLLLASGASIAEARIADVHDGDATHAELQEYDAVVAHADGQPADDTDHRSEPARSGHAQHTCHCIHVHGGWLATDVSSRPIARTTAVASPDDVDSPGSVVIAPQLRPPIA